MPTEAAKSEVDQLKPDLEAYERMLPELMREEGKFALFFDGRLVGVFGSQDDAFEKGYEASGGRSFFVRQITAIPIVQHFSRPIGIECLILS